MSAEENKAVVRRVYTEVMGNDDLSVIPELFADEYVYHSPGSPDVYGPDAFRELVTAYRAAFPDFLQTADLLIAAEGDTVVSRWTATGTHQGEFLGIPPTGKRVTFTGVVITRLAGGKVVEDWELADTLGLLQQLGITDLSERSAG
jgi:steroid delta-isomerase-like uncharacterized protein